MILFCADKHAPSKTKRVRASKPPWITPSNLKKEMHKRDVLKMKAIRSIQPSDWTNFKKHRNYVNGQIKRAKVTYYHNAFHVNEGDIRNTWRVVNEVTSLKTVNSLIKEDIGYWFLVLECNRLGNNICTTPQCSHMLLVRCR